MKEDLLKANGPTQNIHSDEIQEILAVMPNWIMRWGIAFILFILILMLFFSAFIQYPDKLEGSMILTTKNPHHKLLARKEGYIDTLFVNDRDSVVFGQELLFLKDEVSLQTIRKLDSIIPSLINFQINSTDSIIVSLKEMRVTTELQVELVNLIDNLFQLKSESIWGYYEAEEAYLNQRIKHLQELIDFKKEEGKLLALDLIMAKENFRADSSLYADSVIAPQEFRKRSQDYFSKQTVFLAHKRSVQEAIISLSEISKNQIDLEKKKHDQLNDLLRKIGVSAIRVETFVRSWKASHLLISNEAGVIHFNRQLAPAVFVQSNEELFAIESNRNEIVAIANFKVVQSGKLKQGQEVILELDAFPAHEYGSLTGVLNELSFLPHEEQYRAEIRLPRSLTSSLGNPIPFKPEMSGKAVVICNRRSLLGRVVGRLSRSVNNE